VLTYSTTMIHRDTITFDGVNKAVSLVFFAIDIDIR
jgi:hypothetical protein